MKLVARDSTIDYSLSIQSVQFSAALQNIFFCSGTKSTGVTQLSLIFFFHDLLCSTDASFLFFRLDHLCLFLNLGPMILVMFFALSTQLPLIFFFYDMLCSTHASLLFFRLHHLSLFLSLGTAQAICAAGNDAMLATAIVVPTFNLCKNAFLLCLCLLCLLCS